MFAYFLISYHCVLLPLVFTLFRSCSATLVDCAVFLSVSIVMSEDGVYPVGQEELPGACRCVDGW